MIGKIRRVPLRTVWDKEPLFTAWLQENVEALSEVIDLTLVGAESEQSAGAFSVDIVAEDDSGNPVVIENQLEKSDHDHLGKLITYRTAIGAAAAVWIVADPRPEHVNAITWLNESSGAAFYLLKVEAIQIEDSPPAPLMTLIVGPSEEGHIVGETKKELGERYAIRQRFWTGLLELAKHKTRLHTNISPGKYGWIGAGAGKSGIGFNYVIKKDHGRVELYIDRGKNSEEENVAIFETFLDSKDEVEAVFGEGLEWERLEGRRACRIKKNIDVGGYRDADLWGEIQSAMIDEMIRLEAALRPGIERLRT
jgi:hypothetical protein